MTKQACGLLGELDKSKVEYDHLEFYNLSSSQMPEIFSKIKPMYFSAPNGWYPIIYALCNKINEYAKSEHKKIFLFQVKEKFGELRFYLSGYDEHVDQLVGEAELLSRQTCTSCGNPGRRIFYRVICKNYESHIKFIDEWRNYHF